MEMTWQKMIGWWEKGGKCGFGGVEDGEYDDGADLRELMMENADLGGIDDEEYKDDVN
jgi:hypothetical protein